MLLLRMCLRCPRLLLLLLRGSFGSILIKVLLVVQIWHHSRRVALQVRIRVRLCRQPGRRICGRPSPFFAHLLRDEADSPAGVAVDAFEDLEDFFLFSAD